MAIKIVRITIYNSLIYILEKRKTIIFDMDETLIHKLDSSDKCKQADVYVQVPTEDNLEVKEVGNFEFTLFANTAL